MIQRHLLAALQEILNKGKSVLLLGPRQTGKTTLLQNITADLCISLIQPRERTRYEKDPSQLIDEVEALAETISSPVIIIDEVQKVPELMDVAQDLIDRQIAQLILTGSSARKLKRGQTINLLPGRIIPLYLSPLMLGELHDLSLSLDDLLLFGSMPEVFTTKTHADKTMLLDAYVSLYLEEEVRAEALVRNLSSFSHFLELAANESGFCINTNKLSQQVGVAHTTIANYYQILEDCLITHCIKPFTHSKTRHKMSKTNKYLFFDLGVRRLAAREGETPNLKWFGHLFEQFIGLELIRASTAHPQTQIKYWKDLNGPEVDWLIDHPDRLTPIEVKYTDQPSLHDAKHLNTFLAEYPDKSTKGYIVCRVPRKRKLSDSIYAWPWQDVPALFT